MVKRKTKVDAKITCYTVTVYICCPRDIYTILDVLVISDVVTLLILLFLVLVILDLHGLLDLVIFFLFLFHVLKEKTWVGCELLQE